jgi:DNA-binding NtrC family response regulator
MTTTKAAAASSGQRRARVLVIDDDRGIGDCIEIILQRAGHDSVITRLGADGLAAIGGAEFDLVVTDLRLPDADGLDLVTASKAAYPETPVILMTSYSSIQGAVEALRRGANDYIIKPFDNDDFLFSVERALAERRTRRQNEALKLNLLKAFTHDTILGESEGVKRLLALIQRVAGTDANVLIQGESGTGKELVAQAIHYGGDRAHGPFVPVNCGAIPAELIESELFGHVKGAYTGASATRNGLIHEASGGTLFLDEISEMPMNVQVKLLRVLQERQVRPVGSQQTFTTDARFLTASNRNLKEHAKNGTFRADLFYRINVITIQVPPLRERGTDIEMLARHFVQQSSRKFGRPVQGMHPEFVDELYRHSWPGNVRELQNVIERAVILADATLLRPCDLEEIAVPSLKEQPSVGGEPRLPLSIEQYIKDVITMYQDSRGEAELAAMLGIGRKALWMRRRSWGLYRRDDRADADRGAAPPLEGDRLH